MPKQANQTKTNRHCLYDVKVRKGTETAQQLQSFFAGVGARQHEENFDIT